LNGFSDYDAQLMAVKAKYDSLKIRLGYVQLDSWWYVKDPSNWMNRPGTYLYEPVASLFPKGLADLKNRLGVPFITHNRWIGGSVAGDVTSPYRSQYAMSNGVSIDPLFWDKIIGDIASWGVQTYEQDWLNANASASNILGHGEKFMDEMARATSANGLTMQYCMENPRHYMQASKYGNVTTLRSCVDRFDMPGDWGQHLYCSQLIKSVGSWPWVDNFRTNELGNTLLCVLSAGMVGVSDTFATVGNSYNVSNLLKMVRRDGLAVKSDVPMTPTDATYIRRAAGDHTFTCSTFSQVAGKKVVYVWDWANGATNYSSNFKPADFGMSGNVFVYNYFDTTGSLIGANASYAYPVSGGSSGASGTDWKYYVLSSVGPSGIAVVGDQGKFVTFSKNRIAAITETAAAVTLSVAFGPFDSGNPDQPATIIGYAPSRVSASADSGGVVSGQTYNSTTHVFKFNFQPNGPYAGQVARNVEISTAPSMVKEDAETAHKNILSHCSLRNGLLIVDNIRKLPFTAAFFGTNGKVLKKWTITTMPCAALALPDCAFGVYQLLIQQSKNISNRKIVIGK
jgi:hypothetical protein